MYEVAMEEECISLCDLDIHWWTEFHDLFHPFWISPDLIPDPDVINSTNQVRTRQYLKTRTARNGHFRIYPFSKLPFVALGKPSP